jgi:hypothetical protein
MQKNSLGSNKVIVPALRRLLRVVCYEKAYPRDGFCTIDRFVHCFQLFAMGKGEQGKRTEKP